MQLAKYSNAIQFPFQRGTLEGYSMKSFEYFAATYAQTFGEKRMITSSQIKLEVLTYAEP